MDPEGSITFPLFESLNFAMPVSDRCRQQHCRRSEIKYRRGRDSDPEDRDRRERDKGPDDGDQHWSCSLVNRSRQLQCRNLATRSRSSNHQDSSSTGTTSSGSVYDASIKVRLEPAENLIKNLLEAAEQRYAQQPRSQRRESDGACKALNRSVCCKGKYDRMRPKPNDRWR